MEHREKKLAEFKKALHRMLNTADGQLVLEVLQDLYVDASAIEPSSTEITYYRLGQKEFVQGLIKDAEEVKEEKITIQTGE